MSPPEERGVVRLDALFVGIATGVKPNIWLAQASKIPTQKGILVNEFLETQVPDIYAAGDCAELVFVGNKIEQLWYPGRLQGETVAYNLCGKSIPYTGAFHLIPQNSSILSSSRMGW